MSCQGHCIQLTGKQTCLCRVRIEYFGEHLCLCLQRLIWWLSPQTTN